MKNKTKKLIKITNILLLILAIISFITSVGLFLKDNNDQMQSIIVNRKYLLAHPGMLPDNVFYKVKVLRNKITEKFVLGDVARIEFNLLMSDKTIYASKILFDKGDIALSKETALKGENYYSKLVQEYNNAQLKNKPIKKYLDKKITYAANEHQKILTKLQSSVKSQDRDAYANALKFSKINYEFIRKLRKSNDNR